MTSLLLDTHAMLWFFWDDALRTPIGVMPTWSKPELGGDAAAVAS